MKLPSQLYHPLVVISSFFVFILSVFFLLHFYTDFKLPRVLGITQHPGSVNLVLPEEIHVNQAFNLSIEIDTNNQQVNAAGIYLRFNPNHLQVVDIDTGDSFCQFYPEKKYDNSQGLVSLACGSPHPGFSGKNTLMVLKIQPLISGPSSIQLDPQSRLLLSDGKGTNILHQHQRIPFNILTSL